MRAVSDARTLEDGEQIWILPDVIETQATNQAWPGRRPLGIFMWCLLVGCGGLAAWRQGRPTDVAVGAVIEADQDDLPLSQQEGRGCVELRSTRLADGEGELDAHVGGTAEDCLMRCRVSSKCAQSIFSAGNSGCYRFQRASTELFAGGNSTTALFHSAICASSADKASLETVALQIDAQNEALAHEEELKEVQKNWTEARQRSWDVLATMTLDAKVSILHGSPGGMGYAGFLKGWGVNGMLNLQMNDGPQGFNTYQDQLAGTSTQLPCLLAVAASFSRAIAAKYAGVVADEFVVKGGNVLLGPDVEVMRAPLTGRSFETISGEDPYLGSQLVAPYVKEVQKRGIISTVKHWLNNNQEIYRQTMNVEVGDRAQHEIYMPPFKAAFEAGAGAVMCSYNKVYGEHACQNKKLLKQMLREELGFQGFVVSDWGATHDATASANSGLDIEMPAGGTFLKLPDLVSGWQVSEDTIDEMTTHVLSAMYVTGQFDGAFPAANVYPRCDVPATSDWHREVALQTIIESAVLLKNKDNTLPLSSSVKKIALVGKFCNQAFDASYTQGSVYSGGGSGYVKTPRTITPLEGLKSFLPGVSLEWNVDTSATDADVTVVCLAAHAEEGWDRKDLEVPEAKALIAQVRKQVGSSQKIVAVAAVPGAVTTEWVDEADAVLLLFMPGEQVGPAVAQLLTGQAAPSGRLPVSLPEVGERRLSGKQYPGECPPPKTWCEKMTANFSEGVLIGYRWNDAKEEPAAYPFGFGLTYTQFTFKDFSAACLTKRIMVTVKVANVGARGGEAVPQLYIGFPSLRPAVRQLRGFGKVHVEAGEEVHVGFLLGEEDWSFYSEDHKRWVSAMDLGEQITVSVGSSSAHLSWHKTLACGSTEMTKTTEVTMRKLQ